MAGLTPTTPKPIDITLHGRSRQLEVRFGDGVTVVLPFELMRVYSPSAEVKGHGEGQEVLQTGKRLVDIVDLAPVGHYAIQPTFSDGHDSGIYSWDYLYWLGTEQSRLWTEYEARLAAAGASRDPVPEPEASAQPARSGGCGSGHCGAH